MRAVAARRRSSASAASRPRRRPFAASVRTTSAVRSRDLSLAAKEADLSARDFKADFAGLFGRRCQHLERNPTVGTGSYQPVVRNGERPSLTECQGLHSRGAFVAPEPHIRDFTRARRRKVRGEVDARGIAVPRSCGRAVDSDIDSESERQQQREKQDAHLLPA